jgi:hypothetical protein
MARRRRRRREGQCRRHIAAPQIGCFSQSKTRRTQAQTRRANVEMALANIHQSRQDHRLTMEDPQCH